MRAIVLPRKHNRYRLKLPVIFSWKGRDQIQQQGIGLTRDLSIRGAFVFTTSLPPLEADIELKAFLPLVRGAVRSVKIHGQGRVIRVEPVHDGEEHGGFAVVGKCFVMRRGEEVL
jgi:hypothetical protein